MSGGISLDLSINLVNIITIGGGLITLAVAWTKFGGRIDMLDMRVDLMEKAFARLVTNIEKLTANEMKLALLQQEMAAHAVSLAALQTTVERLRVGEGFIDGARRGNIQGEWPSRGA